MYYFQDEFYSSDNNFRAFDSDHWLHRKLLPQNTSEYFSDRPQKDKVLQEIRQGTSLQDLFHVQFFYKEHSVIEL